MSIRLRLAVVFTAAAAILFALGSWVFVTQLSSSLLGSINAQLSARLPAASRYLPGHGAAGPVPGGLASGDYVFQVINPAGKVAGGSADEGRVSLLPAARIAGARQHRVMLTTAQEDERVRVMAGPLAGHPGWVAVAAVSLESYDGTVSDVTRGLVIAGIIFVAAAGAGAYGLARAALSPVERLRRETAALAERAQQAGAPAPAVQVPRTRDEIAALAATMNQLLSRLHLALARQRALVADASHELRTPFAVLSGELELASRPGRSREELASAVARAAEETTRLSRITDQLLFLARADEDRIPARRAPTEVRQLLASSARQAAGRAGPAGVSCKVRAPAGLIADLDPDRVREAVDNLVDNALRFAPQGSQVVLAAQAVGHDLAIEVTDQGPGFPPEYLPHAFERFRRPDTGRSRADGGAGLGLAIVSAIARAHGGRATAGNQPGGGAIVRLDLPGALEIQAGSGAGAPGTSDGAAPGATGSAR
jgi:two-component system OmpR family sensor kinase